jgi:hypothetical protein
MPIDENWTDEQRAAYEQGKADAFDSKPKMLKRSEVMKMSAREAADRMPEVRKAMATGFAPEDDDE